MKVIVVIFIWLSIAVHLRAQTPAFDSLHRIYNTTPSNNDTARAKIILGIANLWTRINPDSSLFYAHEAYELSSKKSFTPGIAESLNIMGWISINMGNFEEGEKAYNKALQYFTDIQDQKGIASVYNGLGVTFGMQENYNQALQYFLKALKIFEKNNMVAGMASCYLKIGTLYQKIHEYDKSLESFRKCIQYAETIGDKVNQAHAYNNIGTIYGIRKQYQQCIEAALKSKAFAEETKTITALANAHMTLGMAFSETKQYEYADTNLNKALFYFKILKNKEQLARTYNGLGNLYLGLKNYVSARLMIDTSNTIGKELNNQSILYDNLETLIDISKSQGDFEKATQYYAALISLKDTLYNAEKTKSIEKLKDEYELDKKQNTIEELKRENRLKTKQRNDLFLTVVVGSLLVILLILSFLDIKNKNKLLSKSKKELNELNDLKDKFFSILSHDLRSPISNILLVIDFLSEDFNINENDREELFKKLKASTSSTLETMDNILQWGKLQSQNESVSSKVFDIKETAGRVCRFLQQTASNKSITLINKIDDSIYLRADENQIEFIIRNLISNSLKFSHSGSKVEIWARQMDEELHIYVKDYGMGMGKKVLDNLFNPNIKTSLNGTSGEIGSGLGLVLCKEFITKNKGTLTVKSEEGVGTTFAISLPV